MCMCMCMCMSVSVIVCAVRCFEPLQSLFTFLQCIHLPTGVPCTGIKLLKSTVLCSQAACSQVIYYLPLSHTSSLIPFLLSLSLSLSPQHILSHSFLTLSLTITLSSTYPLSFPQILVTPDLDAVFPKQMNSTVHTQEY